MKSAKNNTHTHTHTNKCESETKKSKSSINAISGGMWLYFCGLFICVCVNGVVHIR